VLNFIPPGKIVYCGLQTGVGCCLGANEAPISERAKLDVKAEPARLKYLSDVPASGKDFARNSMSSGQRPSPSIVKRRCQSVPLIGDSWSNACCVKVYRGLYGSTSKLGL
jgi:hypothetical protein